MSNDITFFCSSDGFWNVKAGVIIVKVARPRQAPMLYFALENAWKMTAD